MTAKCAFLANELVKISALSDVQRMKFILLVLFFVCNVAFASSLNDFSILLPLPGEADFQALLAPVNAGPQGALIPLRAFQLLPPLAPENENLDLYRNSLRVVAIRLDPCFVEGPSVQACRRQIRLVWQPVLKTATGISTRDAAVHTFYEFDEPTWQSLLQAWQSFSSGNPRDALQVHPVLKAETLRGAFWKKLRATVLTYCGEKNLVRITAMTIRGNERIWTFEGFDLVQGQIRPISISRVNSSSQLASQNIDIANEFVGGVKPLPDPLPLQDAGFFTLVQNSAAAKRRLNEGDLKKILEKAFDYENPKVHNTASLDCVSCHMAASVAHWGQHSFPTWNWSAGFPNRYPNPWFRADSANVPFRSNQFRAFGYFLKEPVVSQRVFNETIEVATAFGWHR